MRPQGKIEYIDFAKGYAMLSIVLYHYAQQLGLKGIQGQAIMFGGTGIHLFFVLSGFGLMLAGYQNFGIFIRRRFSRIYIPFVLAWTLSYLLELKFGFFGSGMDAWLAGLGLVHFLKGSWIQALGGHFWFIAAIVQLYLLFPVLLFLQKKLGHVWGFWGICLLTSVLWWELLFLTDNSVTRIWCGAFPQFLWEFVLGMALAVTYKKQLPSGQEPMIRGDFWNFSTGSTMAAGMVFVAVMVVMVRYMGEVGRLFNEIPALIGYTAISIAVYRLADAYFPALRRFFLWMGKLSFSIYLVHILWLYLWMEAGKTVGLGGGAYLFGGILPLFAAAWLFDRFSAWVTGFLFEKQQHAPSTVKTLHITPER